MSDILAGARVRYQTHRHWWEIVKEAIDAGWYSAIIFFVVMMAYAATSMKSMLWGLWFIVLPAAHLWAELVRWGFVSYMIIDGEDGGSYVRKIDRKFNPLKGNPYKITEPPMKFETLETKGNIVTKFIGFETVYLKIGDTTIFQGERVPLEFAHKMREKKPEIKSDDSDTGVSIQSIGDLFRLGIIDRREAKAMALSLFHGAEI